MKIFGLTALGVVVCAVAGYFFFIFIQTPSASTPPAEETVSAPVLARTVPQGMREYTDTQYTFSLLYPEALEVNTIDEGGGASTITLQNPEAGQGFQIFAVPYFEEQITEERFRRDIPSGVRTNVEEIVIDGAPGVAFYSEDLMLGPTREVWFIKGNILYEVTTPKVLEASLLEVLKTWRFLK